MEKITRVCKHHGSWLHFYDKSARSWKCMQCNSDRVVRRHRRVKVLLVEYKGGKCEDCGYNKCVEALQFHHIDPSKKNFGIATKMYSLALETLKKEVDQCRLICANCHFEAHATEDEQTRKLRGYRY